MFRVICAFFWLTAFCAFSATFTVSTTNHSGAGSLRQAILDANAAPGADVIEFNIGSTGLSIIPTNALPALTDPVTIDGTTQPGFSNAIVEINGQAAGNGVDGLRVTVGGCLIRGLIINRFNNDGIELTGGGSNVVEFCNIGLDAGGTDRGNNINGIFITNSAFNLISSNIISGNNQHGVVIQAIGSISNVLAGNIIGLDRAGNIRANSQNGVLVNGSPQNLIGGSARNYISGNNGNGVRLDSTNAYGNRIVGNWIGVDFSGAQRRANGGDAVSINLAPNNRIEGNILSANASDGIELSGLTASGTVIANNYIGTDVFDNPGLGNSGNGILFASNARSNTVGQGNTIAFNGADGISHVGGTNNSILGNLIYNNFNLAIDLNNNGVTLNDANDVDTGPNQLQNCPLLSAATITASSTEISGSLNSRPGTAYTLEFFANPLCDPTGSGEAQWFLGATNLTTDGAGNVTFTVAFPVRALGRAISATATDSAGNTSELSPCRTATSLVAPTTFTVVNTNDSGPGSLRQAIMDSNRALSSSNNVIDFNIPGAGPHVIRVGSRLPEILEGVRIQGFTQPGSDAEGLLIQVQVDGTSAGANVDGLAFAATDSSVEGLSITRFSRDGIQLWTNANFNQISANFIGLDATGTNAAANGRYGVAIMSAANTLVGPNNVISGNNQVGVYTEGTNSTALIRENIIGLDRTGTLDRGNSQDGIRISGTPFVQIVNNVIAGNNSDGVEITGNNARDNVITGNAIGRRNLPNNGHGVLVTGNAPRNRIETNTLSFNIGDGVAIGSGTNNAIRGNSIFLNGNLGIDLADNGVTANDNGDADGGANLLQNYPLLASALGTPSGTMIQGTLNSRPNAAYEIEFFSSVTCDGEGEQFLGSASVNTDASSNAVFNVTVPGIISGRQITATATDVNGNTSEFSPCVRADTTFAPETFTVVNTDDSGPGSLRQAIIDSNAALSSNRNSIVFNIPGVGPHTINVTSRLPAINESVKIDGAGSVTIDGNAAGANADGLELTASGSLIRGLKIVRFPRDGIRVLTNAAENTISANVIGAEGEGNSRYGIVLISAPGTLIESNNVAGNSSHGVYLEQLTTGTRVEGNTIRASGSDGVNLNNVRGNQVLGNFINANNNDGVEITGVNATANEVRANTAQGNNGSGVNFGSNARSNVVEANTFVANSSDGISISSGINNTLRANLAFDNADLGIDLGNSGPTPNDLDDTDNGANALQNFPVLASAFGTITNTVIQGTLNSRPNQTYALEFFSNDTCTPEARHYLGTTNVNTDASGNAIFNVTVPGILVERFVTGTATDGFGNTSELSPCVRAEVTFAPQTFTVVNTNDSGPGSLRQALLEAGAAPAVSAHLIEFNILGAGPHTITPASSLPIPAEPVIIDGHTQAGDDTIKVRLDGSSLPTFGSRGLSFITSGNVVKGIAFVRWNHASIRLQGAGGNQVVGCLFGMDADGTQRSGSSTGIFIESPNNIIGGTSAADRNVIGYNFGHGIELSGPAASNNIIRGNYIGTTPSGLARAGVFTCVDVYYAPSNLIESNLLSASSRGVQITGPESMGNRVVGNYIGTDASGTTALGNREGIIVNNGSQTHIAFNMIAASSGIGLDVYGSGGSSLIESNWIGTDISGTRIFGNGLGIGLGSVSNILRANTIGFNTNAGVVINATHNSLRQNRIFATAGFYGIGIDIGFDGVTLNDAGDPDSGPNNRQNFPVLTAATGNPADTHIQGTLNSAANTVYDLDFFSNHRCDPLGHGEGQTYLGTAQVTTDASGNATFDVTVPGLIEGRYITATATDPQGNTSEFSACYAASSTLPPMDFVVTNTNDSGPGSFRQALLDAQARVSATNNRVTFAIPPSPAQQSLSGGRAVMQIPLQGRLLDIEESVDILGPSDLKVILYGANAGANTDGLVIRASGTKVSGIGIEAFLGDGVVIDGCASVLVESCVITDNGQDGVNIIDATDVMIGGLFLDLGNDIFENGGSGVRIENSTAVRLWGNRIGFYDWDVDLGNNGWGVIVTGVSSGNLIGGADPGQGNWIGYNNQDGVYIQNGIGNRVIGNKMFRNGGLGIDLGPDGITANDPGDADSGANGLINTPSIAAAKIREAAIQIQGTYNGRALMQYALEAYASRSCDPSGNGEGKEFLGYGTFVTDGSGNATFDFDIAAVFVGQILTATVTDADGNTSEFTPCFRPASERAPRTFTVTSAADSGAGTLRDAIMDSNNYLVGGNNQIHFNIPGLGLKTISLVQALPYSTQPITIDGLTQPGASANTFPDGNDANILINIDGANLSVGDGLRFGLGGNILRGLAITRFPGNGVTFQSGGDNTLESCWIGTLPGEMSMGNGGAGVAIYSSMNTIGGLDYTKRNVISGNGSHGVACIGSMATDNWICWNFAGTQVDAMGVEPNEGSGFYVFDAEDNYFMGNVSCGNLRHGFEFIGVGYLGTKAYRNYAGVGYDLTTAFPNMASGFYLQGDDMEIGGAGQGNYIAYNNGNGIELQSGRHNRFLGNSIWDQMGDPIYLGFSANESARAPDLSHGENTEDTTTLYGTAYGPPNSIYWLDVFSSPPGISGSRYSLGQFSVSLDPFGRSAFRLDLPYVPMDHVLNATGTDAANNTSRSSGNVGIYPAGTIDLRMHKFTSQSVVAKGSNVTFTIRVENAGPSTATDIRVDDFLPGELEYISHSASTPGTVTASGDYVQATVPSLPPGGSYSFTVTARVHSAGYIRNCARALTTTAQTDHTPANNMACADIFCVGPADGLTTIANTPQAGTTGHPISTFSGELFDLLPADIDLGGPMPLLFQRYYASMLKRDGKAVGRLGDNWLHNFEMKLTVAGATAELVDAFGGIVTFTNNGAGAWLLSGRAHTPFQLVQDGSNFVFGDPRSQRLFTFNPAGQLIAISDGRGNVHTLTYVGANLASVADGLGRTLTFQYSASGFLTNISDGARSIGFVQSNNQLVSSRDVSGFTTTYTYDNAHPMSGLMTAMILPEGNVPFSQTFNADGQVATQTHAGAHVTTLTYFGLTTIIRDPLGFTRTDVHTANGELEDFIDEGGQAISWRYNDESKRTAITDRFNDTTFIAHDPASGQLAAITNADGTITVLSYTNRTVRGVTFHDIAQIVYPDGAIERFGYDSNGNLTSLFDRAGKRFGFSYNGTGRLLAATNPVGGIVTYTYNSNGTLATRSDSDTGTTTYRYDSLSRLTNIVHPDGASVRLEYAANDRPIAVTDERGNTTAVSYDRNGNIRQVTDALSQITSFQDDTADRVVRFIDRLGKSITFAYDPLSRLAASTNRNGSVTRFNYDFRRRLSSIVDPGSATWRLEHDDEALVSAMSNPLGQTNRIARDDMGYVVGLVNALGHRTDLLRDNLRRITNVVDALSRKNGFAFDNSGRLISASASAIGNAVFQRNDLGLLTQITDFNGGSWKFNYTRMGRPQAMVDPLNRTNRFSYDLRGRLSTSSLADGVTRSNRYDPAGNLLRISHTAGPDLQYTYDALNRLTSANDLSLEYDPEGRPTNTISSGVNFGAAFDAGGRVTNITYLNGSLSVHYSYDSRDRLTRVRDSLTGTQLDFTYDNAGRLTGITRPNGVNGVYTHDAAGRLARIQEGSVLDIQYALNAAGEITTVNLSAPLDPASFINNFAGNWTYDAAHQISNPGFSYDSLGRLSGSPGNTFTWDGASRLVTVNGATLSYNGLGKLIGRVESGTTIHYYYNYALRGAPIAAERNENTGQVMRYYVWTPGGRLLYLIDAASGNAVYHYHFDRLGSALALTSAAGGVTDAYAYSPYGELLARTGANQQPFTFVGAFGVRAEPAAGLYHMGGRYYDPITARFLSPDPLPPSLANVPSLNPYHYAAQNPLLYIDPAGTDPNAIEGELFTPNDPGFVADALGESMKFGLGQWQNHALSSSAANQWVPDLGKSGDYTGALKQLQSEAAPFEKAGKVLDVAGNLVGAGLDFYGEASQAREEGKGYIQSGIRGGLNAGVGYVIGAASAPLAVADGLTGGNFQHSILQVYRVPEALLGDARAGASYEKAIQSGKYGVVAEWLHGTGEAAANGFPKISEQGVGETFSALGYAALDVVGLSDWWFGNDSKPAPAPANAGYPPSRRQAPNK